MSQNKRNEYENYSDEIKYSRSRRQCKEEQGIPLWLKWVWEISLYYRILWKHDWKKSPTDWSTSEDVGRMHARRERGVKIEGEVWNMSLGTTAKQQRYRRNTLYYLSAELMTPGNSATIYGCADESSIAFVHFLESVIIDNIFVSWQILRIWLVGIYYLIAIIAREFWYWGYLMNEMRNILQHMFNIEVSAINLVKI